jgi:hypothetical protein
MLTLTMLDTRQFNDFIYHLIDKIIQSVLGMLLD